MNKESYKNKLMKHRICGVFNVAPLYRAAIYQMMEKELACDFYIGDRVATPLKKMDYSLLKRLRKILKYKKVWHEYYWQRGALSVIKSSYTDIIITGDYHCLSTLLILILARFTGKRTYAWTHGIYGKEHGLEKILKSLYLKLPHGLFLYGDYAKRLLKQDGFREDRMYCIYNSLDYDKQLKIRSSLRSSSLYVEHFSNNNPVLIFLGRIQKVKRIDELLEAMVVLRGLGHMYNLVIVGKEVEETDIYQKVKDLQLEKQVWFYGPSYDEATNGQLFYSADVCVSPGNIGLTAIHALMYGCPVITHNNFVRQMPEFEAICDGSTGKFFKENDIEDLSKVIHSFYSQIKDHKQAVREECYKVIDRKYNPYAQIKVMKAAIFGEAQ